MNIGSQDSKDQKNSKSTNEVCNQNTVGTSPTKNQSGDNKSKSEKSTQVNYEIIKNDVGLNSDSPYKESKKFKDEQDEMTQSIVKD